MRKIYLAILAALFMSTCCISAQGQTISGVEVIDGAKEEVRSHFRDMSVKIADDAPEVLTRSFTDRNGRVWETQLLNYGPNWHKYFKMDNGMASWKQVPFYEVVAVVHCNDDQGVMYNWYQAALFWPSKYFLGLSDDDTLEGAEPATIEEIIKSEYAGTFKAMKAGSINCYDKYTLGIIDAKWFGVSSIFEGYYGFIDTDSSIQLNDYTFSESYIDMRWKGSWTEDGATTSSGSFNLNFKGEGFISGFEKQTYTGNFTQLHLFDFGEVSQTIYPGVLYEIDFDPVKMYRIMAHNAAAYIAYDENPAILPSGYWLNEGYTYDDMSYMYGSAYTNLNATSPLGEYHVQELITTTEGYGDNTPQPGTIIPGGYNYEYSRYDGAEVTYDGNIYPLTGGTLSVSENSFTFLGNDRYGNIWDINFPECCIHSDRTDYTKYESTLSGISRLFGDKSANLISKSNGQVNVTAAEDGVIYVYTTTGTLVKTAKVIAGEKTSIELGTGLYIVKVGKTATKVIL